MLQASIDGGVTQNNGANSYMGTLSMFAASLRQPVHVVGENPEIFCQMIIEEMQLIIYSLDDIFDKFRLSSFFIFYVFFHLHSFYSLMMYKSGCLSLMTQQI